MTMDKNSSSDLFRSSIFYNKIKLIADRYKAKYQSAFEYIHELFLVCENALLLFPDFDIIVQQKRNEEKSIKDVYTVDSYDII